MTYKKKTWMQKLRDKKGLPKVMELKERFPCYNAVHKMGAEDLLTLDRRDMKRGLSHFSHARMRLSLTVED